MRKGLLVAIASTAIVLTTALPSSAASGDLACGDTVTGTVTLTRDLTCTDVGLRMTPGATLDLGGHTLRGPGSSGVALPVDADMPLGSPVTVRNGTIRDWGWVFTTDDFNSLAVRIADASFTSVSGDVLGSMGLNATIDRSIFRDAAPGFFWGGSLTVRDSTFVDSWIEGGPSIPVITVTRSTFTRAGIGGSCTDGGQIAVSDSRFTSGHGGVLAGWCRLTITRSDFRDLETAVRAEKNSAIGSLGTHVLAENRFSRNGVALDLTHRAEVTDSEFTRNRVGIISETAWLEGAAVEDITLLRNTFSRNGDGVIIDTLAHVGDNTATRNTAYGLYVPRAVDLGGNVANRNGVDCVGVVCP
ncbi:right-handed parallel beta-helix repeat-containing protein [Actinotalea solisilvae]|uniref:right-handed parallel beta-helix repeat-containing protein n=1 Tax=Actinotalea solisilvae TaxID=2072922 RepID=UPI0018F26BCA|nr:right-handed parallel beta-helix repeat-containing protein [Actinotalea solisilvae]